MYSRQALSVSWVKLVLRDWHSTNGADAALVALVGEVLVAIAEVLDIPAADVEGVATFYSQIFRQPVGRHIIRVCDSMVCYIGGHESVVSEIQSKLGIGLGQTTADGRFTLLPVCCLGNCDKAPALMIDDDTFGDVQPAGVAKLLEGYV